MDKTKDLFTKSIKDWVSRNGLSLRELADRAGISQSGLYKMAGGFRQPSFDNMDRIANALGIEIADLFGGAKVHAPTPSEALEIVRKALSDMSPRVLALAPSQTPEIQKLIATITGHPELVTFLIKSAHAYLGDPAINNLKSRPSRS